MNGPKRTREVEDVRHKFGRTAESLAEAYLRRKGYRILQRNLRSPVGELDLVANQGDVLVFIEVKARRSDAMGGAVHAVDGRKRAKLIRLASQYLARHRLGTPPCRFDVILCTGGGDCPIAIEEHIENAFELPAGDLRG
jgi:putative endonuclease